MILSHHARVLQLFGYLAHLQKIFSKICDFLFSSFDLSTGIILKQLNKIKNLNIFFVFFHFHSSLLFLLFFFPVVLPYCGPCCLTPLFTPLRRHRDCRGDRELLAFIFHQRARVGANCSPRLVALGSPPGGDTTGRHNGETQRGNKTGTQNGKQNGKMKTEKKSYFHKC